MTDRVDEAAQATRAPDRGTPLDDVALQRIQERLAATEGHVYLAHRPSLVRRHAARRMRLRRVDAAEDYLGLLAAEAAEVEALAADLMPGVAGFFHDPAALAALDEEVLAPMVRAHPPDVPIRAWVPCCGAGQEAWTLAVLLLDRLTAARSAAVMQIFGTESRASARATAAAGAYPAAIAADVGPDRLARFFLHHEDGFRVAPHVRAGVIFPAHDLLRDPPFSRLDLVCCRGLLPLLQSDARALVLARLRFALAPGAHLLLGPGEAPPEGLDGFEPVAARWCIFRRTMERAYFSAPAGPLVPLGIPSATRRPATPGEAARALILQAYAPACLVVDEHDAVVFTSGPVERCLRVPPGEPTTALADLARPGLYPRLACALRAAAEEGAPVVVERVGFTAPGGERTVRLTVRPLEVPEAARRHYLVVLEDVAPAGRTGMPAGPEPAGDLERALRETRADHAAVVGDLERTHQALVTAHEAVLATNAELQARTDELGASQEALQSLNAELVAVNVQLEEKVAALLSLTDDLDNLLDSTRIATLFLDERFRIKRFTPAARALFHLRQGDVGRPLADLSARFDDPRLLADAALVLAELLPRESVVAAEDGRWFQRRIVPYRTARDRVAGVVLSFSDVTELRQAQAALELEQGRYRRLLETAREGIGMLDADGRVSFVNERLAEMLALEPAEILGRLALDFVAAPDLRTGEQLVAALREGKRRQVDLRLRRADGDFLWTVASCSALQDERGVFAGALGVISDITARRRNEREIARRSQEQAAVAELGRRALKEQDVQLVYAHAVQLVARALDVPCCALLARGEGGALRLLAGVGWLQGRVGETVDDFGPRSPTIRALTEGGPVVVGDGRAETGYERPPLWVEHDLYSGVCLAIHGADGACGVLGAYAAEPRVWQPDEVEFLQSMANILSDAVRRRHAEVERDRLLARVEGERNRIRILFDQAPVCVALHMGPDHVYAYANPSYIASAGGRTLLGRSVREAMPELVGTTALSALDRVYATGEPFTSCGAQLRLVRSDGSDREAWYDLSFLPYRRPDGAIEGVMTFCVDITDVVRTSRHLEESEVRFRRVVESAPLPVMVHAEDGALLAVSRRLMEASGYGEAELTDFGAWARLAHRDLRDAETRVRAQLEAGAPFAEEAVIRLADGRARIWRWSASAPQRLADGRRYLVSMFTDITDRVRAEEELENLTITLERRVQERTAIAEQRLAQLQQLTVQLDSIEQRERKRIAETIHDHLQQLLVAATLRVRSIDPLDDTAVVAFGLEQTLNLLDTSIEVSRTLTAELRPPVLYEDGLSAALRWLADEMASHHGLRVEVHGAHDQDPRREEIAGVVFKCVRELLFNVVKHAGVVRAEITVRRTEDEVVVEVRDAGRGFEVDLEQVYPSRKGGYGLFSVRERMRGLGGELQIDTRPGAGVRARLRVPDPPELAQVPEHSMEELVEAVAQAVEAAPRTGAIRVLLVDDHEIVRDGIAELLRAEPDLDVVAGVGDGPTGVDWALAMRPDVVLMDVNLPGINGIEATRRIKQAVPHVQVVGLSVQDETAVANSMRDAGAAAHLSKAGPPDELVAVIRRVYRAHPVSAPGAPVDAGQVGEPGAPGGEGLARPCPEEAPDGGQVVDGERLVPHGRELEQDLDRD